MPIESGGAASLPLPTGASTLAEQQSQTTHLSEIETAANTKLDALLAQTDDIEASVDGLEGSAITIATNTGTVATNTTNTNTKLDTLISQTDGLEGSATTTATQTTAIAGSVDQVESKLDTLQSDKATATNQTTANNELSAINAGIPTALGQTTMANSMPVAIASDQSPVPISGSVTATVSGAVDTELPSVVALNSDSVANPTAPAVAAYAMGFDSAGGATPWFRIHGTGSGGIWVQGAVANGAAVSGIEKPVLVAGWDGGNKRTIEVRNTEPLVADYGVKTRLIPNKLSTVKTAAGTPAASLVVRAGPCWLYDIFVSNQSNSTACYVTLFDAVAAPSHGGSAAARKIVGRRIGVKVGTTPLNFREDFDGLYFATGCVIVLEMAEDDATANTSGAPTCAMGASFIAAT